MRWYSAYGQPVWRAKGNCSLATSVGSLDGNFDCVQVSDSTICMRMNTSLPRRPGVTSIALPEITGDASGTTNSGEPFAAKPLWIVHMERDVFAGNATLEVRLEQATVGEPDTLAMRHRYGLTNLVFQPNRQRLQRNRLSTFLGLDIGEDGVAIRQIRDYEPITKRMRAQGTPSWTSVAETSMSEEQMDHLCCALTFGQGSTINWLWREDFQGRRSVGTIARQCETGPYTGVYLIPTGGLPDFVGQVFAGIGALFAVYPINEVIELVTHARNLSKNYVTTCGMMLAIALELLTISHARSSGHEYRMPQREFAKGQKVWRRQLRRGLGEAYPAFDDLDAMLGSIGEGPNRTTFKEKLSLMASECGVRPVLDSMDEELRRITKTRNHLIHSGQFAEHNSEKLLDEFFLLLGFVDRLVLKLLGYSGPYRVRLGSQFVDASLS